ncbi:hypothetical protein DL764_002756 [Monosporascus ibericus]|uniref:Ams2/SPT21 N-terminal domain-containing protein n=1 Tax=Monosporascus ibericus TaxID=155417 RepID=A0A4Q4TJ92_9PEZI|nr:hypothetical protein DL764_002756 [Monosporascus ibericus]
MAPNNAHWDGTPNMNDEYGLQLKPMGLKVHYTFDQNMQDRCLARWPHILQVQTIPLDDRSTIGVVDLKTCLRAIADCSPELAGGNEKDFAVYAYDYSEPDTPLVGQGMLSSGLSQGSDPTGQPKLVTGRVTKNLLAIFGNGIKETLEVRLKLTAVPRATCTMPANVPIQHSQPFPILHASASNTSEHTEWHSFVQSNPNLGHSANVSAVSSPALGPVRPSNSGYEARNEFTGTNSHEFHNLSGSRPASAEPIPGERPLSAAPRPASRPAPIAIVPHPTEESTSAAPGIGPVKSHSRPNSRASRRGPTGRPRGRPPKNSQQVDGSTSGYEEGTDADDGPARKKRAKITQVERSNSATFRSGTDSLRVAASNAQSIRSFRPVGVGGDAPSGNHLQEIPRAPTPVPDSRLPSLPQGRPKGPSVLRHESMSNQGVDGSLSYLELSRSMSQGLDARSPVDSIAPSPSHFYSDEASPADIGSSPPVPRSALFSRRSSPIPSSPVLPPMRIPPAQPDSGFMSGSFDDGRIDDEDMGKTPRDDAPQAPIVEKPKQKPRRKPAKKQPAQPAKPSQGLIIQEITPGPPELLPRTSIYNPPHPNMRRVPLTPNLSTGPETSTSQLQRTMPEAANLEQTAEHPDNEVRQSTETVANTEPSVEKATDSTATITEISQGVNGRNAEVRSPAESSTQNPSPRETSQAMSPEEEAVHRNFADIEKALNSFKDGQNHQYLQSESVGDVSLSKAPEDTSRMSIDAQQATDNANRSRMAPLTSRRANQGTSGEPGLPMIPASDSVLPQLTLPFPMSEPPHPETDALDPPEVKANKNFIKRQAIKQKLEEAIAQGEMPTYCRNCAALQTPTWRKIWKQEHRGVPEYHEYSEKAGHVTAINILERDAEGKSTLYEMIKKALGPNDDKSAWTEVLLCNPCGIWFSKWKAHRPPEKWEKDEKRLSQVRKKRANGSGPSRSKKARTKSDNQMNLTSEAGLLTDPIGPPDGATSPGRALLDPFFKSQPDAVSEDGSGKDRRRIRANEKGPGSTHSRASTHSRGSGTPGSPIRLDDELGTTRRLLFPSPRKDGEQRVLGEVAINIVQTSPEFGTAKGGEVPPGKENSGVVVESHSTANDEFADLFGTTPARPSTPPPKANTNSGSFKTPTRPTPSHRPITRSVSRSMRSARSIASPSQALMLERTPSKTPSKTPRSAALLMSSGLRRRSPRNNDNNGSNDTTTSHLLDDHQHIFDSPFTKSLNQLLSEANDFVAPTTPNRRGGGGGQNHGHGGFHLDLGDPHFDFGSLLSTDGILPSSPPMRGGDCTSSSSHVVHFGGSLTYDADASLWAQIDAAVAPGSADMGEIDETEETR